MARSRESIYQWLVAYGIERFGFTITETNIPLAEIGIDSLKGAELLAALEKWTALPLSTDFLATVPDVQSLIDKLVEAQAKRDDVAHPYARYINPYLATKLSQLKIDRCFVRAEGCYLFDEDGEQYLDFMAQYGALPFGHHPKAIWDVLTGLRDDAEPNFVQPSLLHSGGQLAKRLIELAPPGLHYVTFANSGTEAVEAALKMARHATGRQGILSTLMGFHGKTFGALSATGKADYQTPFGLPLAGFEYVPYGDIASLERTLAEKPDYFAAFIVEPIQGEGGVTVPPPGYLREAKALCERFGALLIVDEVQTGLGRTGELFACNAEEVVPDIMTLAKALSGGLVPIGACLCSTKAYSEKFAMKHSSTFAGNALAARAGLATLELLTRDDGALLAQVKRNGRLLRNRLEAIQEKYPTLIKEVCGKGFMLGIRFSSDRAQWYENFLGIAAEERELAQFISSYLLNVEHIRVAPTLNRGEVLRIQPPLIATRQQCEQVADAIERAVSVLAQRNTGAFYRAILRRQPPVQGESQQATPADFEPITLLPPTPGAGRFAFIMHPLDEESYADYDVSLAGLNQAELREFATSMEGLLDPVIGSSVQITSKSGAMAYGDFIMVPHTADQLRKLPQTEAVDAVAKALKLARSRGAQLVGLGAYSSIVTGGGALVADTGVAVTSGNSYTVVASIQAIETAIFRINAGWANFPAAVVGAAGAIGTCMAMLLAEKVPSLVLIGNPAHPAQFGRARLEAVAQRVGEYILARSAQGQQFEHDSFAGELVKEMTQRNVQLAQVLNTLEQSGRLVLASDLSPVSRARLVVMSTSFPGKVMDECNFQESAIICDISRPRSVGRSVLVSRPDVLVLDGGVVALPGQAYVGPYGLKKGTAYACMAETMLLSLDGHFENTSIGTALSMVEINRQQALAGKHGFGIAELQSFGKPLTEASWQSYIQHAQIKSSIVREKAA